MSTKSLLSALAVAFAAAADSLQDSAEMEDGAESSPLETVAAQLAAASTVTPAQIAAADLDTDGLPWDARIHASTKTKTAKGTWTLSKRVDPKLRETVIAELRAMYASPAPAQSAPAPAVTAPVSVPSPVAAPAVPALPAISLPTVQTPFTRLTDWLAKNTGDGHQLSSAWVDSVFAANNMTLAQLATPDMHGTAELYLTSFKDTLAKIGVAEVA